MKDDEEDLGKELAVQREHMNAMKAEYETGLVGIRADIAQYTADGVKREAQFAEERAKRDAEFAEDRAKRDAEFAKERAKRDAEQTKRDAEFAEARAKWEAKQAEESAKMTRTIYGVVSGGIGLAILILGFLIRLPG